MFRNPPSINKLSLVLIARSGATRTKSSSNWELSMQHIRNFLKNSKGATAIEYGLIAALIAIAAITAMSALGKKLNTTFTNVSNNMSVS
jgi:pilus assembly protein Flp/PilA